MSKIISRMLVSGIAFCIPSLLSAAPTLTATITNACSAATTTTDSAGTAGAITINGTTGAITIDNTKAIFGLAQTAAGKCTATVSVSAGGVALDQSANQTYSSGSYSVQVLAPATNGNGLAAAVNDVLCSFVLLNGTATTTANSTIIQRNSTAAQTFKLVQTVAGVLSSSDASYVSTAAAGKPFATITITVS